jgi:ABC-2 type transport system permease protein
MNAAPGSFLWLLAHDVRVNWRRFAGMFGAARPRTIAFVLVGGGILMHLAAWPAVRWAQPLVHGDDSASVALLVFLLSTFSWLIAQSLFGATRALFDRGDLDLLLGSPLPAGRIFAAKAAAIATSTFGSIALLILPVANLGAVLDRPSWLCAYPVLIALALIATAIGVALSIALFFLVGARRARIYAQLLGAAIGGAFILAAQIVVMLQAPMRQTVTGWFDGAATTSRHWLLWAPADAARGDLGAVVLLAVLGIALFTATVKLLGGPFARASLAAVGAASGSANTADTTTRVTFRGGFGRSLRRKELRLLRRDPNLFAQLSLQIIYTLPVAVVLLRSDNLPAVIALAPTIVVIAAQVTASLAWITVSGEDAPELIATAPVSTSAVDRAKLGAVVPPVLAILILPLAALALISPYAALLAALFAAAAGASTALLNFWHPMPGNRRGMLRRHSQSKLVGLVEHALAISWGIAVVFALMGSLVTTLPVAIVAGILLFVRAQHRKPGRNAHRQPARGAGAPMLAAQTARS